MHRSEKCLLLDMNGPDDKFQLRFAWRLGHGGYLNIQSIQALSISADRISEVDMIRLSLHRINCTVAATLAALMLIISSQSAHALDRINSTLFGVAIKGYDTVAYHTEGRAVKGSKKFSYNWNDAEWHFISNENRDLFAADPERFAPQYGGY